jgi:superfamily II DNA helicase RecQ
MLRTVLGKENATWSNKSQRDGIMAALECEQDIIAIMATGAGKTMIALIPALLEERRSFVTVIVLPLRSLMTDYKRKLHDMSIGYEEFLGQTSARINGHHNIILVSADAAKSQHWITCLADLNERRRVRRIVFDELHLALTSSNFRPSLRDMDTLRSLDTQIIGLSGTIPYGQEETMKKLFGLTTETVILRECTNRPELRYILKPKSPSKRLAQASVKQIIESHLPSFTDEDRILVFVPYKAEGDIMANELGCEFYQGGNEITNQDRLDAYNNWRSGIHRTMVCTSAFGTGNDYSHVRLVIHYGTPLEMIDYIQESSRAGRDAKEAYCYIIPVTRHYPQESVNNKKDITGQKTISTMLWDSNRCLRYFITKFIDGKGLSCHQSSNNIPCSRCTHPSTAFANRSMATHSTQLPQITPAPVSVSPRKRKQSSAFAEAHEQSKRRKLERDQKQMEYVAKVKGLLDVYDSHCTYCLMKGFTEKRHSILRCHTLTTLTVGGRDSYLEFKKSIRYQESIHGAVCWKCHLPQCSDMLHDTFNRTQPCPYEDVLPPIGYAIYMSDRLRLDAGKRFQCDWTDVECFVKWLNARPVNGELTNLLALFCWYTQSIHVS